MLPIQNTIQVKLTSVKFPFNFFLIIDRAFRRQTIANSMEGVGFDENPKLCLLSATNIFINNYLLLNINFFD